MNGPGPDASWDHTTHESFYEYYAKQSESPETREHFRRLRDALLAVLARAGEPRALDVADIGGGAGTAAMLWAELGHRVCCLDINEALIELGRRRASEAGLPIRFETGSATDLPLADASVDVCMAPELLEHVGAWERCLDEFARVLRRDGILYLSTTNKLCPLQSEFNLPLYSWYPGFVKRRYERLARTTRPELANYAKYPAVNWFTFYSLRRALERRGFGAFLDRFDVTALKRAGGGRGAVLAAVRAVPPLRLLGQMASRGSQIVAVRRR